MYYANLNMSYLAEIFHKTRPNVNDLSIDVPSGAGRLLHPQIDRQSVAQTAVLSS